MMNNGECVNIQLNLLGLCILYIYIYLYNTQSSSTEKSGSVGFCNELTAEESDSVCL